MTTTTYLPSALPGLSHLREKLGLSIPADEITIYSANTSFAWLTGMADALEAAATLKIRAGLDLSPNQPSVDTLSSLARAARRDIHVVKHNDGSFFHPKVYVSRHGAEVRAVVGSSNGSSHGFGRSVEANLALVGRRGGPEDELIVSLTTELENAISTRLSEGTLTRWRLPDEVPPPIPPTRWARAAPPKPPPVDADAWESDPGFVRARYLADFYSPISGVVEYIVANGHQGGFDIPNDQMPAVEQLLPQGIGAFLELAWRFIDQAGQTVFRADEGPRQVVQSGYGGNNRVITAGKPNVSRPLYNELERLGVLTGYVHALYKVEERDHKPPRLWMIHTLPAPVADRPEDT